MGNGEHFYSHCGVSARLKGAAMAHIAAHKHELRASIPDATHRFLRENAGAAGIGELIGVVCLGDQKQTAIEDRLTRIENLLAELIDRKYSESTPCALKAFNHRRL